MSLPRAKLKKKEYGYLLEFKDELNISINELQNPESTKLKVRGYVNANMILVENASDFDFLEDSYDFNGVEHINEMDLFDVERRDLTTMKELLNAPENASKTIPANKVYNKKRMKGAIREIVRDGLHGLDQFDSLYNAIGILKAEPSRKPKNGKGKAKK